MVGRVTYFAGRTVSLLCWGLLLSVLLLTKQANASGNRIGIQVRSSLDGTLQPNMLIIPDAYQRESLNESSLELHPLVISLHSWSGDWTQRNSELERLANERGWFYLFPDFRGINQTPQACGSKFAQQDILDAMAWVLLHYPIDRQRIYLTGVSGGGHMTMLMAGRYPQLFTAASAWVGISDLSAWHALQAKRGTRYQTMMEACCGGTPRDGKGIANEYLQRSPLTYLAAASDLPLDLAAGIDDGHEGSVPIDHTLRAFNCIVEAKGGELISEPEMTRLLRRQGLTQGAREFDPSWQREIHFRRRSDVTRVSIFAGGHEGLATGAIDWLARWRRSDADVKLFGLLP